MTLRGLAQDFRQFPATMILCTSWILIFAAMVVCHIGEDPSWTWSSLLLGVSCGHRFGDLALNDLAHGQVWRLLTCNFVHYGFLHIGLNLIALYQLGMLIESWYGSYQLIFIYTLTGGLGNLVSAAARWSLHSSQTTASGGGSVVVMGLVGLCAMVGWRSRSKIGRALSRQMILIIGLTAALGLLLPFLVRGVGVDNWGHAGGTLIGAMVGIAHQRLLRRSGTPSAWGVGIASSLLMIVCGLAQAGSDLAETGARTLQSQREKVAEARSTYQTLRLLGGLWKTRAQSRQPILLRLVIGLGTKLDRGETRTDYRRLRSLVTRAAAGPLTAAESNEVEARLRNLQQVVRRRYEADLNHFWSLDRGNSPRRSSGRSILAR
jgi:rhomboid protease GluP